MSQINLSTYRSPIFWVPTVYFAMGLPFVSLSMVSVLMFSDMGISNSQIAFWTSLIMLPWFLKALWSPLLELFNTKKHFVILTEFITSICFCLIAFSLHLPNFFVYSIAFMGVMAISGATHDVAGDGVYISELNPSQQAKYIGWQGAFYNLAKIITNGLLVYLAGWLKELLGIQEAWMVITLLSGFLIASIAFYHLRSLPSSETFNKNKTYQNIDALKSFWAVIRLFFTKKHIIYYILFIVLYRFAEGFAMKIAPLFLKAPVQEGGLGLSIKEIGIIYGTFGTVAFILGSVIAGYYISKKGLKRTLFILCCFFNIPFVVYLLLAIYQPNSLWVISTAIIFEYFGYGFGFVGLMLFMMQQIAPGKHKMAHYAFATGIMNLGIMIPGMISGYMSEQLGYCNFFIWVLIATIPAFIVTWLVPFTYSESEIKNDVEIITTN